MIPCEIRVYLPYDLTDRRLTCDGVSLESIVERVRTPVYVYSARAIREAYRAIDEAFAGYPHAIHYALKANSTLALLRVVRQLGGRADANSIGELQVAMRAGFMPDDLVFTGVGKTRAELEFAVAQGVAAINVESPGELDRIAQIAADRGTAAARLRRPVRRQPQVRPSFRIRPTRARGSATSA